MSTLTLQLALAKNFLAAHGALRPEVAIVLGSGLGAVADMVESQTILGYEDIPNFPATTVMGHKGRLVFGSTGGNVPVLVFDGRVHYYEGLTMQQAGYPAYLAHQLGASVFIATNAAGGLNEAFSPGDLMLIRDHLNLMGDNPVRGPESPKLGARFLGMREAYDPELFEKTMRVATACGIRLQQGVYAAMSGPAYETDAELRMLYKLGADAVGMSTVPEVMAARHVGMKVVGLSVISNDAYPYRRQQPKDVGHEGVLRVVEQSSPSVRTILEGLIEGIGA